MYDLPSASTFLIFSHEFFYVYSGLGAEYSMACLAFERMLAIYWPLRMKRLLSLRFTLLLLILPVLETALYIVLDMIVYRPFPQPPPIAPNCFGDYTSPYFIIYAAFNECNFFICSTLNLSFSFAVAIKYFYILSSILHLSLTFFNNIIKKDSLAAHVNLPVNHNLQTLPYSTRTKIFAGGEKSRWSRAQRN